jgi:hypothetical protein
MRRQQYSDSDSVVPLFLIISFHSILHIYMPSEIEAATVRLATVRLCKSVQLRMFDFTPLQLFYSAFRCSVTWTPAGVGVGRVGVGVVRLKFHRKGTEGRGPYLLLDGARTKAT